MADYPRWACPDGRPHVIVKSAEEEAAVMATAVKPEPKAPAKPVRKKPR